MRRALVAAALVALVARAGAAQQPAAGQLVEAARAQLDQLNPDSASALLERALQPGSGASAAERTRGFVLYGIAQLLRDNVPAARAALRQALQLDASLRVDSLAFFSEQLERLLGEERTTMGPIALTVDLDVPADTTVPVEGGVVRIAARPSRSARVVTVISPVDDRAAIVWGDTAVVRGVVRVRGWNLRGRDGQLVPPGRYSVRAVARDSANVVSQEVERVLVVSRMPPDTQPLPPPLALSAFLPETLQLRRGPPVALALGLGLGAAIAVLPAALGNSSLNQGQPAYTTAYAVAGTVSLAGIAGFITGHRIKPMPENMRRNQELRQRDALQRQNIAAANARARENAPLRVVVEGGGP